MLEVEVRYRTADRAGVIARLTALGAVPAQGRTDEDQYYDPPGRDMKTTGESFRVRRVGESNCLTYKGPRRDAETRTRTEVEIPLGDGPEVAADADRMLTALGFRRSYRVRKRRTVYRFTRGGFALEARFDNLDGFAEQFVELEILAEEAQYDAAKAVLFAVAAELGLSEQETRSYMGMVLEAQGKPS